jgi:hypothetical protein
MLKFSKKSVPQRAEKKIGSAVCKSENSHICGGSANLKKILSLQICNLRIYISEMIVYCTVVAYCVNRVLDIPKILHIFIRLARPLNNDSKICPTCCCGSWTHSSRGSLVGHLHPPPHPLHCPSPAIQARISYLYTLAYHRKLFLSIW